MLYLPCASLSETWFVFVVAGLLRLAEEDSEVAHGARQQRQWHNGAVHKHISREKQFHEAMCQLLPQGTGMFAF